MDFDRRRMLTGSAGVGATEPANPATLAVGRQCAGSVDGPGEARNHERQGPRAVPLPGALFSEAVREQPRRCLRAAARFPERIPATPTQSSRNQEAPIRGSA